MSGSIDDILLIPLRDSDGLGHSMARLLSEKRGGHDTSIRKMIRHRTFKGGEYSPRTDASTEYAGKRVVLLSTFTSRVDFNAQATARVLFMHGLAMGYGAKEVNLMALPFPYARQDDDPQMLTPAEEALKSAEQRGAETDTIADLRKRVRKLRGMQGDAFGLDLYVQFLSQRPIARIMTSEDHNPAAMRQCVERHYGSTQGVYFNSDPFILFGHLFSHHRFHGENETLSFRNGGNDAVVALFDKGSWERGERFCTYAGFENVGFIRGRKSRKRAGDPTAIDTDLQYEIGEDDLEGKTLIVPDDIFDSGGTVVESIMKIDFERYGTPRYVVVVAPYPVMSGEAFDRLADNRINLVTTSFRPSMRHHTEYGSDQTNVLYVAEAMTHELITVMTENRSLLSSENFGNLRPHEISDLYSLPEERPFIPFVSM